MLLASVSMLLLPLLLRYVLGADSSVWWHVVVVYSLVFVFSFYTGVIFSMIAHQPKEPVKKVAGLVYGADLVEHPDAETVHGYARPQGTEMLAGLHLIRHDSAKLAALIMQLAA